MVIGWVTGSSITEPTSSFLQMMENQLLSIIHLCLLSFPVKETALSLNTLLWIIREEDGLLTVAWRKLFSKHGLYRDQREGGISFVANLRCGYKEALVRDTQMEETMGSVFYALTYNPNLPPPQLIFWGRGWYCYFGTKLIWQLQQYRHLGY